MRLINADALMEKSFEIEYADGWHKSATKEVVSVRDIDNAPTIDAVEVVRCKDCKHYSVKGKTTQFGFCGYRHAGTDETDYCSRAVRRKE